MSGSICPLEWRYGSTEMRRVFSRRNIVDTYIAVEAAILKGLEEAGLAPSGCWSKVESLKGTLDPAEVDRLESRIGHDIAAIAEIISNRIDEPCSRFVHLGATSYDIVDTTWALILGEALKLTRARLIEVIKLLASLVEKYRDTIVVGRTHARHALPITFGFKMANYAYELTRSLQRLRELNERVVRSKISGAVGTMAGWLKQGLIVENTASSHLGLKPHLITTQVAPRDGFAEVIADLAILASQLERLSLEVRELMRDEISEVYIDTGEVGSSAMPHKRNPSVPERVCGLSRVIRGLLVSSMENIALMHERDLTNSSSERVIIPHVFLIIDQMLLDTISILRGLRVDEVSTSRNLELTQGRIMSECIMVKLVLRKGYSRIQAHELLRKLSRESIRENKHLREILMENGLYDDEIGECFDYSKYLGNYSELIDRVLKYVREQIEVGSM
ncbi:adenylosuccinate lyase [Desulfurococcus amylolyticus]|uniref:Adenylosuccinate lyase n=1 Tax=Desulfurococcus amylolyticus (strain DSM 18924 / JCM 16383 / VKM B-2413 / 1221n) TaxID=490899 RepID=B8D425_DESA1|nr:adenylosuccinate lyase [Desulfurococcus amylolyticus]ACL10856.1 Adenylosuccinate lyase [Desulfurococcus amylolyticus 1221n]